MVSSLIERYQKGVIIFHWVHSAAFIILILTGGFMFLPGIGISSGAFGVRILHRVAAVVFVGLGIGYAIRKPEKARRFIGETLRWHKDDLRWFFAAPRYYFGGRGENMPKQGYIDTGQKLWQLVIIGTGLVFIITGAFLWSFRSVIAMAAYQWILFIHGIAFLIVFVMFLFHVYMGVFHPGSTESLRSMINGKVSESYARSHYRKWYDSKVDSPN